MLRLAVIFLLIALIAAVFGYSGLAIGAAGIAKFIFFVCAVLFVVSYLFGRSKQLRGDDLPF